MSRALIAVMLLALALGACDRRSGLEVRTFRLQHKPADAAEALVTPYIRSEHGAVFKAENALTVRETPQRLDEIAQMLEEYDRPATTVLLRFQLIAANGATTDPAIAELANELQQLFRFRGYRLVADAAVRSTPRGEFFQELGSGREPFQIRGLIEALDVGRQPAVVQLGIGLSGPDGRRLLETRVTVPEGETFVIGSARDLGGGALILTVRPELAPN